MATSTTQTNFDPALKQLYKQSNVENLTYKRRPMLGLLPKFEGFGGRNMPVVLVYGNPQGRSAVFSTAQANRSQVRVEDFLLTRVNNYSVASIDGEVIESTRGDNVAFLSALKAKIDGAMNALSDDLEGSIFRLDDGWLAQLHATTAPTVANPMVLTLAEADEITNFEVGMTLECDDTSAGSSLRAAPATAVIDGVNRTSGTITTDYDNSGGTTDWAVSDYLFVEDDSSAKMSGFAQWLPSTAPVSGDSHFGVDRSVDSRLYGVYHDGSSDTVEEAGIDAQSKVAREGGAPDVFVMHHKQMRRLVKELGAKKDYSEIAAQSASGISAKIGYRAIEILGDHGPIKCIAANKCQANIGWMIEKETWQLASLGPAVKFLMEDGLRILRQATADGYEVRIGFRGNLCSKAPVHNAHIALPS